MKPAPTATRWLRYSVAVVWLATGLTVFHPYFRAEGSHYLAPLGLPDWLMYVTCAGEILLGLWVALGRASTWVTVVQVVLVLGFSALLACTSPWLLVNPFGMLTKNLPLLAVVGTAWLVEREGWSRRALWLLRGGMAVIWITEGIFPKMLFQQPTELNMVAANGLLTVDPPTFLMFMGACETLVGVATLLLQGWPLRVLLAVEALALVVLPFVAGAHEPTLWIHPFEPLVKNVPILAGTLTLLFHPDL